MDLTAQQEQRPKVGLGIIVIKNDKILLGRRIGAHGTGTWQLPGGHLEFNETWEECAKREVAEESGLEIKGVRFGAATNDIFRQENKHYITIFMLADYVTGEPQVKEPNRCAGWRWVEWQDMPRPLFMPLETIYERGFNPFRSDLVEVSG